MGLSTFVCSILPYIMYEVNVTYVEEIATYSSIESLGDGERTGPVCLHNSTQVVRVDELVLVLLHAPVEGVDHLERRLQSQWIVGT